MTIWNALYHFWNRLNPDGTSSVFRLFLAASLISLALFPQIASGQFPEWNEITNVADTKIDMPAPGFYKHPQKSYGNETVYFSYFNDFNALISVQQSDTVPRPSEVLRKSMILPGWGQVVNKQTWKVPVIYGILAGLTYYSILSDRHYRDYKAAYYNSQYPDGDERFGPTPDYINPNQNPESLRFSRNMFRNRRDLTFIGIGLAYGLNIIDAYVFAHMRDFDVSDDLSARLNLGMPVFADNPVLFEYGSSSIGDAPDQFGVALTFTINLH